jgi:hypothetical protein
MLQTKLREDGLPRKAPQLRPKGFRSMGELNIDARSEWNHSGPGVCLKKDGLYVKEWRSVLKSL